MPVEITPNLGQYMLHPWTLKKNYVYKKDKGKKRPVTISDISFSLQTGHQEK